MNHLELALAQVIVPARGHEVNPELALSCALSTLLVAAQKFRERRKHGDSGKAWPGGEEWRGKTLVGKQRQEVGWHQG